MALQCVTDFFNALRWPFGTVLNVLANDITTDPPIFITGTDGPPTGEGTVVLNPDFTLTYQPPVGFQGNTSFTYDAEDFAPSSDTGLANIRVPTSPGGASVAGPGFPVKGVWGRRVYGTTV